MRQEGLWYSITMTDVHNGTLRNIHTRLTNKRKTKVCKDAGGKQVNARHAGAVSAARRSGTCSAAPAAGSDLLRGSKYTQGNEVREIWLAQIANSSQTENWVVNVQSTKLLVPVGKKLQDGP